jgi:hypothetical protein
MKIGGFVMRIHLNIFILATVIALILTSLSVLGADLPPDQLEEVRQIKTLRDDINLCNLLNGIYLSKDQMESLLLLAKEAEEIRNQYHNEQVKKAEDFRRALESLRKEVIKGTGINQNVAKRASGLNKELKDSRISMNHKLARLEQQAGEVLNEGQKQILQEFKPCLLPPRNLNHPTRAGQAFDSGPFVKTMERVREVPPRRYKQMRHRVLSHHLKKLEEYHVEITEQEQRAEYRRAGNILDRARSMDPVKFQLHKEELANDLSHLHIERDKKFVDSQKLYGNDYRVGKIGNYFLTPRIVPILEEKIALSDTYSEQEEANLLKLDPAESCADGTCAINPK